MQQQTPLRREDVLDLVRRRFPVGAFTTHDIARGLGVSEMRARGAVAWLVAASILRPAGKVARRDRCGLPYQAALYLWSGKTEIRRCPQDREARRHALERPSVSAFDWLARRW
ncbi:hypothetical protein BDD21_4343 [Thiocapsa rosea]|uniref:Uncharacterized protein n=1 Tax=Thiocapsa rosea TaxID=69360 RepID=A0A495VBP6_9GAMM|nr:hypothetical protein BDD21_4343 [Thiocapsa rosea]